MHRKCIVMQPTSWKKASKRWYLQVQEVLSMLSKEAGWCYFARPVPSLLHSTHFWYVKTNSSGSIEKACSFCFMLKPDIVCFIIGTLYTLIATFVCTSCCFIYLSRGAGLGHAGYLQYFMIQANANAACNSISVPLNCIVFSYSHSPVYYYVVLCFDKQILNWS